MVIDVAAGPSTYGPLVSRSGTVTAGSLPSLKVCVCGGGEETRALLRFAPASAAGALLRADAPALNIHHCSLASRPPGRVGVHHVRPAECGVNNHGTGARIRERVLGLGLTASRCLTCILAVHAARCCADALPWPSSHAPAPCPQVVAQHAQRALFEGSLAATVSDAARALFAPDVAMEHLEHARNILVGVRGDGAT